MLVPVGRLRARCVACSPPAPLEPSSSPSRPPSLRGAHPLARLPNQTCRPSSASRSSTSPRSSASGSRTCSCCTSSVRPPSPLPRCHREHRPARDGRAAQHARPPHPRLRARLFRGLAAGLTLPLLAPHAALGIAAVRPVLAIYPSSPGWSRLTPALPDIGLALADRLRARPHRPLPAICHDVSVELHGRRRLLGRCVPVPRRERLSRPARIAPLAHLRRVGHLVLTPPALLPAKRASPSCVALPPPTSPSWHNC